MKQAMIMILFLLMIVATVLVGTSVSSAADLQRVDVIENAPIENQPGSMTTGGNRAKSARQRVDVIDNLPTAFQWDSAMRTRNEVRRVDVIDSIVSPADVYPSTSGGMRVDVIDELIQ